MSNETLHFSSSLTNTVCDTGWCQSHLRWRRAARSTGGVGVEGLPFVVYLGSTDTRTSCYRWPKMKWNKVSSKPDTVSVAISACQRIDGKIASLFEQVMRTEFSSTDCLTYFCVSTIVRRSIPLCCSRFCLAFIKAKMSASARVSPVSFTDPEPVLTSLAELRRFK